MPSPSAAFTSSDTWISVSPRLIIARRITLVLVFVVSSSALLLTKIAPGDFTTDQALSIDAAWRLSNAVGRMENLSTLLSRSDYVSLHVPALDATRHLINEDALASVKKGAVLLNFARESVVDPAAELDSSVRVGAYSVIGPHVKIGAGTTVGAHCVIEGRTTIGQDNRIFQFASLGAEPQDKKYKGEDTELVIGDRNTVREFVTVNRGTGAGGGITRIGSDNMLLAYTHVAHDCIVGNHCVFSNNSTLAGHVTIEDWVIMSGFAGVHQFCRVGAHAFIGMGVLLSGDVPPFTMVAGDAAQSPDAALAQKVIDEARHAGLLVIKCGVHRNVMRFLAPLVATPAQVEEALQILQTALARVLN